jgi:hypothetical protein
MSRNFKAADLDGTQAIRYANVAGQYRAVRLPYKGSAGLAAVFVLPDKQYKSVFDAAAKITGAAVLDRANWVNLYDIGSLTVTVPRFKVSINQLAVAKVGEDAAVSSVVNACICCLGGGRGTRGAKVAISRRNPLAGEVCRRKALQMYAIHMLLRIVSQLCNTA